MRRIFINQARDKGTRKPGRGWLRVDLDRLDLADEDSKDDVLALDEAIQLLEMRNKPCAELVKLRLFAGLTTEEAGGPSPATRSPGRSSAAGTHPRPST
jgi:DNA-directed RNA polymerase specialized sigma24 family protein